LKGYIYIYIYIYRYIYIERERERERERALTGFDRRRYISSEKKGTKVNLCIWSV